MKAHSFIYLIIYSCFIMSVSLQAQEHFADRYNVSYITMDDGLPHNFIDDIYKDTRGFLWISTAGGGLSRYDGYEFIHFNLTASSRVILSTMYMKTDSTVFGSYPKEAQILSTYLLYNL